MLRRLLILCALALVLTLTGCSGKHGCDGSSTSCTRVLFIGNSYTFVNELPGVFAKLAGSAGVNVATTMVAEGGATLADHAAAAETTAALASERWNYVVLQEQSEIPSIEQFRQQQMYPAARTLVGMVRGAGAVPIFFLTWAHRDGWPENGLTDYAGMQSAIDDGYLTIAKEQNAAVAPVGYAWWTLLTKEPGAALWQDDGSHPTVEGTYLAACVFYAAIVRQSPVGLHYHAGLSDEEAATVQQVAADVVLGDPQQWGLR